MKYLRFYYRTRLPIARTLVGVDNNLPVYLKCLINYFVLNSELFKYLVDADKQIAVSQIESLLERDRLSVAAIGKLIAKVTLHYIFRFFSIFLVPKNVYFDSVVKTYVDAEYNLFRNEVEGQHRLVLIFPFPLSLRRQISYVSELFREKRKSSCLDVKLYGLPYSLRLLLRVLFRRTAKSVFDLEFAAAEKFSNELISYNFSKFYNSDDFEPLGLVYNSSVRAAGRRGVMYLHGVGTYAPFVSADELKVFNQVQADYYMNWGDINDVSFFTPRGNLSSVQLSDVVFEEFVFYSQISSASDVLCDVEARVVETLRLICLSLGSTLVVRKHPNFSGNPPTFLVGVNESSVSDRDAPDPYRTVGLSLYSTTYYSNEHGFSVLVEVPEIPVRSLFPASDNIVPLERLTQYFGLKN